MPPRSSFQNVRTVGAVLGYDPLLAETLRLAEAAQDYALRAAHRPVLAPTDPLAALAAAGELSRITARIGFCLAWLLARRAVHEGELEVEEAREEQWRLGGHEVCQAPALLAEQLPVELLRLSQASAELYGRVARLDNLLDGPR